MGGTCVILLGNIRPQIVRPRIISLKVIPEFTGCFLKTFISAYVNKSQFQISFFFALTEIATLCEPFGL